MFSRNCCSYKGYVTFLKKKKLFVQNKAKCAQVEVQFRYQVSYICMQKIKNISDICKTLYFTTFRLLLYGYIWNHMLLSIFSCIFPTAAGMTAEVKNGYVLRYKSK